MQADDHLVIIMQMIDFSFLTFQFSARVENNGLAGAEKKIFSPDFPIFAPHVRITTTTSSSKQHIESSTNPANFYFEFQKAFYSSSLWAPPSSFLASIVVLIGKSQFKYFNLYKLDNFQIKVVGCLRFIIYWVHSRLL